MWLCKLPHSLPPPPAFSVKSLSNGSTLSPQSDSPELSSVDVHTALRAPIITLLENYPSLTPVMEGFGWNGQQLAGAIRCVPLNISCPCLHLPLSTIPINGTFPFSVSANLQCAPAARDCPQPQDVHRHRP